MPDATPRPTRCKQCGWKQAEPGYVVCSDCASRIVRETCTHPWKLELIIRRTSNGYQHPKLRCRRCSALVGSPKLKDVNADEAAAVIVNEPEGVCAHCGRPDAIERHHWAPQHLFGDADEWPTSLLCPACHRLWHLTTGTAGTSQPRIDRSRPASVEESRTVPEVDPWAPVEDGFGGTF